jgi:cytidylate kinase
MAADLATVEAEMSARDTRDRPNMRQADDAVLIDTSEMSPDEAFERAATVVRGRLA